MKKKIIEVTEEEHRKNVDDYAKELMKLRNKYANKVLIDVYAVSTMKMVIGDLLNYGLSVRDIAKLGALSCKYAEEEFNKEEEQ